jgi:hypothetical protein
MDAAFVREPSFASLDQVCVAPNTCDSYRLEIGMEPE